MLPVQALEQLPGVAKAAAQALHTAHCKPACSNDATSRMDFDAVRRELFSTSNAQPGALWPYAVRNSSVAPRFHHALLVPLHSLLPQHW